MGRNYAAFQSIICVVAVRSVRFTDDIVGLADLSRAGQAIASNRVDLAAARQQREVYRTAAAVEDTERQVESPEQAQLLEALEEASRMAVFEASQNSSAPNSSGSVSAVANLANVANVANASNGSVLAEDSLSVAERGNAFESVKSQSPFAFFQKDSAGASVLQRLARDGAMLDIWMLCVACLTMGLTCFSISYFAVRFFWRQHVGTREFGAGEKGLLTEDLANATPTLLSGVEEEAASRHWNANIFSNPVQEAFGLSAGDTFE